jgi:hypothetical protein
MRSQRLHHHLGIRQWALALVVGLGVAVVPVAGQVLPAAADRQPSGPGCAPSRPAAAYYSGAVPAPGNRQNAPVPCMTVVGPSNETAMVGVSSSGSVFYAPVIGDAVPGTDGWVEPCPTNELIGRSNDLGGTWAQLSPAGPRTSGCVPAFMTVNPETSRIWFPTTPVQNPPISPTGSNVCGAHVVYSDDEGAHWTIGGDIPCPAQGGEKLLEGAPPASGPNPIGYPHVAYYCANQADQLQVQVLWCYKSLDGGQSWAATSGHPDPPLASGCPNQTARPGVVGASGVLVFPTIECGVLGAAISSDEGATWTFVSGITSGVQDMMPTSSAVDRNGDVYFAYRGPGGLPYLVTSANDGATWSSPMMVAPPGVLSIQRVAVTARDRGQVALAYLGTTDGTNFSGYLTESHNVFDAKPLFWSATVNDPTRPLATPASPNAFQDRFFYLSTAFGPDGTPWAGFHCADTVACPGQRIGVVGRLTTPAGG